MQNMAVVLENVRAIKEENPGRHNIHIEQPQRDPMVVGGLQCSKRKSQEQYHILVNFTFPPFVTPPTPILHSRIFYTVSILAIPDHFHWGHIHFILNRLGYQNRPFSTHTCVASSFSLLLCRGRLLSVCEIIHLKTSPMVFSYFCTKNADFTPLAVILGDCCGGF